MSMPHRCKCGTCGREMPDLLSDVSRAQLGLPGAVMPIIMGGGSAAGVTFPAMTHQCTIHGLIPGPECEQCRAMTATR